jgi:hypothetical protein
VSLSRRQQILRHTEITQTEQAQLTLSRTKEVLETSSGRSRPVLRLQEGSPGTGRHERGKQTSYRINVLSGRIQMVARLNTSCIRPHMQCPITHIMYS